MSLESAIKAMSTPAPVAPAPIQQQSLTKQEVTAATSEAETKASNGAQLNAAETIKESVVADAKSAEATDTKPAAAKPEETASAKFSALAKKEKAIVKRDQEIKAKEQAFAEREAKITAREASIKASEELWEKDIFKALETRLNLAPGTGYQKLTDLVLEGKSVAPESQDPVVVAKKTIEQFKAEQKARDDERLANEKKAKEEAELKQKQELEQAWEAYNNEVNEFVKSNADDYELINTYSQQALIAQTVDEFYNANKKVLSVKEAADMVESYLESEAKKALATKKFGSSLKKDSGEPKAEAKKEDAPAAKTLTNSMQPTSASVLPPQSEQDRMRRAMAALERNK